jgi:arginase
MLEKEKLILVKNRSDIGAGTRGADMGIDAMEIAAINAGNAFFSDTPYVDVETHNESIYNKVNNPFAKRINHVVEQCRRVSTAVEEQINSGKFPLVLSGDHSSALGTISGVKAAHPEKRLGVIWIDAHGDLHSPYTSPSGNIHGMPLAAALNEDNLDCQRNEVSDNEAVSWEEMKNIGVKGAKLNAEDLLFFGVRDTEQEEDRLMQRLGIRNFSVEEMIFRGINTCLREGVDRLKKCDAVYISFDVDSMDCDRVSYGTGTPVPRGFDPKEVIQIIQYLLKELPVVCLEFVEVNPLLDTRGNKMAETAFEVLEAIVNE